MKVLISIPLYVFFLLVPVFSFSQTKFENKNTNSNTMEKKIITSANAPAPIGPYSHANLIGNTLYVSGQVAKDAQTGEMIQSDIKAETKKVMENVQAILKEVGMDLTNVVKTTIFCTNLGDFAAINEVYGSFFTGNFPARETVQVVKLPLNANVEISVVAVK
jgi:2-iminobutanoate/2-iminopropanoate deaminase